MEATLGSCVAGVWRREGATSLDLNPANVEDVVAEVHFADASLAREAVDAAHAAFAGWRDTPAPTRGEILHRAASLMEERSESIAREVAREVGKTLVEARAEPLRGAAILRFYAGRTLDPDGDTFRSHATETFLMARRHPLGVIAAITPWNFPVVIPAWKIAPALAYGNVVVWKPAEPAPLTAVRLTEVLMDAGLPEGVLNLVLGRGSVVGDVLTTHDAVSAVTFTGSNVVGAGIRDRATARGKKVQLELGGKNGAIVLADADLPAAAESVARGAFFMAGQKCTATSRVLVEEPVFDEFAAELVRRASTWKLGDPLDPETIVGPLVSDDQLRSVLGYLDLANEEGGQILAGGTRVEELPAGNFVWPTVLAGLADESRVNSEEIFGPVVSLTPIRSYDDGVKILNRNDFGLAASLYTTSIAKAMRFVDECEAGIVKVNQEGPGAEPHVPFGGLKASSNGVSEQGKAARDFFTHWKTVYMRWA